MSTYVGTNEGSDGRAYPSSEHSEREPGDLTRRTFLTVAGVAAAGSLAGCLDRVAGAVTNTVSSPAGAMSAASVGFRQEAGAKSFAHDVGGITAEHVPATIRGGSGLLSGKVDAEGWLTSTTVQANDYNSVRSNKRRSAFVPGDDTDDDHDDLYAYLDGHAVVGERFSVCLPDAQLPGGGPGVADEITPRRIIQYLTGEARTCAADGDELWCWGRNERARLNAELSEDRNGRRGVAAFATDDGVCVAGVPADEDVAEGMIALVPRRSDRASTALFRAVSVGADDADEWGEELVEGDVAISSTVVCPIVARPEGATAAFYALLYVTRCRHRDEYVYTGGWLIDDAALYEDSCTLLVAGEPTPVVGFTPEQARDERAARELVRGATRGRRRAQGAVVYDGEVAEEALAHLPDALHRGDGLDGLVSLVTSTSHSARTGRNPQTGKEIQIPLRDGPVESDESTAMRCLVTALDCPVAHLIDASDLDTAEKAAAYDAFLKIEGAESGSTRE